MNRDELSVVKKFSYGVGHVLNDLTASMWFSYLLIYLHRIVNFENSTAGYMMLIGQIADAIATAFVGFESDKTVSGFCNIGRRKSWHLAGVISVLISFPFMFNLCITCENAPEWARFYYYAPFVVIFQFGWAATQISHLALIPQLSTCDNEKVALNAIRYAFTVISNLFVYGVAYLLFKFKNDNSDTNLSRDDASKFTYLTFIVCGVGILFQLIFYAGTNEKNLMSDEQMQRHKSISGSVHVKRTWLDFLKCSRFYFTALLYMFTRLIVNMTQVYLPMFLTDTLDLDKSSIALVPLICYISGFLSTFPIRALSKYLGSFLTCFIGLCIIFGCSALYWFDDAISDKSTTSIISSILLGSGSTVILVSSLSLTTDLIGQNTGSGAFVYGAMSFTDKLSNGVTVALLQQFSPCEYHTVTCDCRGYYHGIMAFLPAICGVIACVALFVLYFLRPPLIEANPLLVNQDRDQDGDLNDASVRSYGSISSPPNVII